MNLTTHFTLEEFNKENLPLTKTLINNFQQIALFLEVIRWSFGKPIIITSGLRSPMHNKEIGGVVNSYHLYGKAVDIKSVTKDDYDSLAFFCCKGRDLGNRRLKHYDVSDVDEAVVDVINDIPIYMEFHSQLKYIHIQFGTRDYSPLNIINQIPF